MNNRGKSAVLTASVLVVCGLVSAGCNLKGEDSVRDKDFVASPTIKVAIGGAGSTFVAPIMNNWIAAYQQSQGSTTINYRPIGSGAGLAELKQSLLGFAVSDAPLTDLEMAQMYPVVQVPVTAGPVCAIYNVPGLTAPLRLSGGTLAGIFQGDIISWQDLAIARENPGVKLPKAAIIVVHRSDGSGTTSILTSYLSKASAEWNKKVGQGLKVQWPVGIAQEGSKGVLEFVKENPGTIGYAELNYSKQAGLAVASIGNRAGSYVAPNATSAGAAIEAFAEALEKDARASIVDPPASAKEAYPITGLAFVVIPKDVSDAEQQKGLRDFVQYSITTGQNAAEGMAYAKLPNSLQQKGLELLGELTAHGQPVK